MRLTCVLLVGPMLIRLLFWQWRGGLVRGRDSGQGASHNQIERRMRASLTRQVYVSQWGVLCSNMPCVHGFSLARLWIARTGHAFTLLSTICLARKASGAGSVLPCSTCLCAWQDPYVTCFITWMELLSLIWHPSSVPARSTDWMPSAALCLLQGWATRKDLKEKILRHSWSRAVLQSVIACTSSTQIFGD